MKCRSCGHRFSLGTSGMGFSDAPGVFLAAAVVGGLIALGGYALSEHGWPAAGMLAMLCGGALGVGSVLLVSTAEQDATAYGPRKCPACDAEVAIWPWST